MQEYLNDLKNIYGYNNYVMYTLTLIIPVLIHYYGIHNQELILTAIENCPIYFEEDENIRKRFGKEISKVVMGFYGSFPKYENNKLIINRFIYINQLSKKSNKKDSIKILIHELGHLIKSYQNEYYYENGFFYQRSGLSTIKKIKTNDGSFRVVEKKRIILEELLNDFDENQICGEIFKDNTSHYPLSFFAKKLLDDDYLGMMIRDDQINGSTKIKEVFGEKWDVFNSRLEDLIGIYPKGTENSLLLQLQEELIEELITGEKIIK